MSKLKTVGLSALGVGLVLPIAAATIVFIGNSTGTAEERCDRFWMSQAASNECHGRMNQAYQDRLQADIDRSEAALARTAQRNAEIQANIRDSQTAMDRLARSR